MHISRTHTTQEDGAQVAPDTMLETLVHSDGTIIRRFDSKAALDRSSPAASAAAAAAAAAAGGGGAGGFGTGGEPKKKSKSRVERVSTVSQSGSIRSRSASELLEADIADLESGGGADGDELASMMIDGGGGGRSTRSRTKRQLKKHESVHYLDARETELDQRVGGGGGGQGQGGTGGGGNTKTTVVLGLLTRRRRGKKGHTLPSDTTRQLLMKLKEGERAELVDRDTFLGDAVPALFSIRAKRLKLRLSGSARKSQAAVQISSRFRSNPAVFYRAALRQRGDQSRF